MHVHLLGCKSSDRLTRRLGFNKLELCMTIMRELQKVHTSASIICGFFGQIVRQLIPGYLDQSIWGYPRESHPSTQPESYPNHLDLLDPGNIDQTLLNNETLEAFLNDSSMYNFWGQMSMPDQISYN